MQTRMNPMRIPLATLMTGLTILAACGQGPDTEQVDVPAAPTPAVVDSLAAAAPARVDSGGNGSGEYRPSPRGLASDWLTTESTALTLSLQDIGYASGFTLNGSSDQATITLPVNSGLTPTALELRLIPTPGMPAATLVLMQRDRILAQRALTDTTSSLSLPLQQIRADDGRATLTLGLMVPGRDVCEAQRYYRTVIDPSSAITYSGAPRPPTTVNGFFEPWLESVTFYVADLPSRDAAQAALDASAFMGRRYRGMSTKFLIRPLPPAGTPMTEPGPFARALVWSPTGTTELLRSDSSAGTMLAIAARRDARQLFTLADGDAVVAAPGFSGTTASLDHNAPVGGAGTVTFETLGFPSRTVEGATLMSAAYPFALADLGGTTIPSALRLVVQHSVLPPAGNGSLRVHLNGALVYSRTLERSSLDVVVPLPSHLLLRDNVLEVRFQVVLGEGACVLGGAVFTATIDPSSSFVTDRANALPPGFGRFPSAYIPAFSVLLDPMDRFRVELAAQTIGAMQQTTRTPLAPAVARDAGEAVGPLLAIGTSHLADVLEAPIHSDGFRLRDRDGKVWDEFSPSTTYATMQGWSAGGRDILLLHHTGAEGAPLLQLLDETLAPYGWFGTRGDLVIRGVDGPARSLTLANAGWRLEQLPENAASWWARYRTVLFILAGLLIVGLLVWFYPRVVRRELDPAG